MKILVGSAAASSLSGFRLPLIKEFVAKGHEVVAIACEDNADTATVLKQHNVRFVPFGAGRTSINPFADALFILRLIRFMRRERFDLAFLFQQKAVLYGGIAARLAKVTWVFAMITGLGYMFMPRRGIKFKVVNLVGSILYRLVARRFDGIIFQNPDDLDFIKSHFLKKSSVPLKRVYGSGVDLDEFPFSEKSEPNTFLFVGRLIADKGIFDYIEAGKQLVAEGRSAELRIAGGFDSNPSAIKEAQLREWENAGVCKYLGKLADVRPALADASVFVLPSDREGTPRSALEAMATGRPIVTTNSPGCRETVFFENVCRRFDPATKSFSELPTVTNPREHLSEILMGDNGFLVPTKNPEALAATLAFYIDNPEVVQAQGRESRRLAEKFYELKTVTNEICDFVGVATPPLRRLTKRPQGLILVPSFGGLIAA